ncbi:MAG: hypothetical protein HQL31_03670 [Planctomycetes bacterium]|nr:hypothetical protein [Planctomycetota bacterium]
MSKEHDPQLPSLKDELHHRFLSLHENLKVERKGGAIRIRVPNELGFCFTTFNFEVIEKYIADLSINKRIDDTQKIVLDFSDVVDAEPGTLAAFVIAAGRASEKKGVRLAIAGLNPKEQHKLAEMLEGAVAECVCDLFE